MLRLAIRRLHAMCCLNMRETSAPDFPFDAGHPLKRQPLSGREREGEAFLRKAASLALPHQSPTRFTAGEEEDDEEG